MLQRPLRRLVGSTALIVAALTAVRCSDQFAPKTPPSNAELLEVQAPIIFVGAGDIADCTEDGDSKTALLVESILNANPTAWAFVAGDNVYETGSAVEYRDCYGPTWGRFKTRTRPSLGNHEYDGIELAEPAFNYFGDDLWEHSRQRGGYYSFNLGTSWHIVVLNSNKNFVPTAVGSAQDIWLKADLAANNRPCVAAIWHHPRFFSSRDSLSTNQSSVSKPFWERLYAAGADLVLNGHYHKYERFAPMKPDGTLDRAKGIREFLVGMGGSTVSTATNIHVNSEVRNGDTFGVLELTLNASSYSWRFVPVAGKTFSDAGTSNCHGAPSPPPNIAPTADFSPPSCIAGVACAFTAGGSDPDGTIQTREWDFGDPPGPPITTATATTQHTYAVEGVYSVTLKVTDNSGASSIPVAQDITVAANGPPIADFSPPSCIAGVACTFTAGGSDPDGTIQTREWDFGDPPGPPLTTATATAQHTYAVPVVYSVTLKVTDDGGASSAPVAKDVTVAANSPPVAAFTPPACTTGVACNFLDQSTDDGGIVTRNWDFADPPGSVVSTTDATLSHTYTTPGDYSVTLTVVDNGGATNGPPPAEHLVTVTNTPPTAAFNLACNKLSCAFTDQSSDPGGSIKSWSWNFGDDSPISTAQNPPPHIYATGGSKTVTLTVTDDRDEPSAPTSQTVTVVANVAPTAAFASSCSGLACAFSNGSTDGDGTFTSSWEFGDGGTSSVKSPSHTYVAAGPYNVTLIVTDDDGATGTTVPQTVTVTAPIANAIPRALFGSVCTKLSCVFTDRSTDADGNGTIVKWSWSFGDATTSTIRHPTHAYKAGGSYKVKLTVTDNRGATSPITHTVTVTP